MHSSTVTVAQPGLRLVAPRPRARAVRGRGPTESSARPHPARILKAFMLLRAPVTHMRSPVTLMMRLPTPIGPEIPSPGPDSVAAGRRRQDTYHQSVEISLRNITYSSK